MIWPEMAASFLLMSRRECREAHLSEARGWPETIEAATEVWLYWSINPGLIFTYLLIQIYWGITLTVSLIVRRPIKTLHLVNAYKQKYNKWLPNQKIYVAKCYRLITEYPLYLRKCTFLKLFYKSLFLKSSFNFLFKGPIFRNFFKKFCAPAEISLRQEFLYTSLFYSPSERTVYVQGVHVIAETLPTRAKQQTGREGTSWYEVTSGKILAVYFIIIKKHIECFFPPHVCCWNV